jgi:hypothetical protein
MNDIMHEHLNKLRIISKIRKGQKLDTTHGQLSVYEPGFLNWIYRRYYGDNKEESARFLQDFYKSLEQSAQQLISEIKINSSDEDRYNRLIYVAINLAEKIKVSLHGIECLSHTYMTFPKMTATLEGIVQDFAVVTYRQLIEVIPEEQMTKALRSKVLYNDMTLVDATEIAND